MKNTLGVDAKTVIRQITLMRCGMGSNIELFSYQSPDQKVVQPKNSDIGGYHIAFYVDDIKAAADDLHAKNVKTMMGPIPITEGPAAGQAIVYFNAPWGLQLEAISVSEGHGLREGRVDDPLDAEGPGQVRLTYFTNLTMFYPYSTAGPGCWPSRAVLVFLGWPLFHCEKPAL